uniref:Uncharacterized protein n=1 Tax=Manihot esculenta TaxID=3983 RepID=A0A2C9W7I2_MANES
MIAPYVTTFGPQPLSAIPFSSPIATFVFPNLHIPFIIVL